MIYEVTVHVRRERADAFLAWLRGHIAQIVALPGFEDAELHELLDEATDEAGWCIRYRLRDRDALADYLRDHAPRLRADGIARFGDAMRAQRRVMQPLAR